MMMVPKFWNGDDGKCVSDKSYCRYWRNSDILPVTWNSDINNNVSSATLSHVKNVISDYNCNKLCNLMSQVKIKSHPFTDISILPEVFHSSFLVEPKCSPK